MTPEINLDLLDTGPTLFIPRHLTASLIAFAQSRHVSPRLSIVNGKTKASFPELRYHELWQIVEPWLKYVEAELRTASA